MDYGSLDVILQFVACGTRECVNVTIVDDTVPEPDENFFYILEPTLGLDSRIDLMPTNGEIVILDNDR